MGAHGTAAVSLALIVGSRQQAADDLIGCMVDGPSITQFPVHSCRIALYFAIPLASQFSVGTSGSAVKSWSDVTSINFIWRANAARIMST